MVTARIVASLCVGWIVATLEARPIGESDADFIIRIISASPMSQGSRVKADLADCSLIIDQTSGDEKKRTVVPLRRLDERSFEVIHDEFGWFVLVHTEQGHRDIKTGTAKWSDRLAQFAIHIYDEQTAHNVRDALVRTVRFCRQAGRETYLSTTL
jgi:hypothetical protein